MRLVDLDAIRERFNVAEYCSDCKRKNFDCYKEQGYSPRRICEDLDDVPVIDAIPIDWLNQKYAENDPNTHEEDYDYYLWNAIWNAIAYILTLWEEEQEDNNG